MLPEQFEKVNFSFPRAQMQELNSPCCATLGLMVLTWSLLDYNIFIYAAIAFLNMIFRGLFKTVTFVALASMAQLVGVSSRKPKGCRFSSWSVHMPRLWVWFPQPNLWLPFLPSQGE